MECVNCEMEVQASNSVCPSCQSLLSAPEIGKLGSPAKRLIAYIFDYVIGIFFIMTLFVGAAGGEETAAITVLLFIAFCIVQIYMLTQSTSLGKRILKMRVYKKTGERAGFGSMLLREIIGKSISGMIFGLGYIWILIDDENQSWHDKLISSIVIEEK